MYDNNYEENSMKQIVIPETAEAYQADIAERAFPNQDIAQNDFYRRLIGWIVDNRTPLLFEGTHPDEATNMSINFNWLMLRDYTDTKLGDPATVHSLYSLHEITHMTQWLPTRLDEVTAAQYAEQFTSSEYRASNESEVLVHYRIPELRGLVLPGTKMAVDIMKRRGIAQPPSHLLNQVRALLIESDTFDHAAGDDPDTQAELARIKRFSGNRQWATAHYDKIRSRFTDPSLPLGYGLTDAEYEPTIVSYEPHLSQAQYEANVMRNVRFGYAMCGLALPQIENFDQARRMAAELEGRDALV
jgi:hypothetical protein